MSKMIELKKCYRDYRWQQCNISNQEVLLFENRERAYKYFDKGYGCNIQELDSSVVIDEYFGEYEPCKWIRIEEENEHFGVMSLRTDWHLGGINRGIVAYRRDYTYLSLMSNENKAELMKVLNGDKWEDIRFVSVTEDGKRYGNDVRFSPVDRDKVGLDEWIRQNLMIKHEYSHYPEPMAASDFKFYVDFVSAYWYI